MVHSLFPNKFTIAEDLGGTSRMNDTAGFDSQWDEHFFVQLYRTIVTPLDANRDIPALASVMSRTFVGKCSDRILYTGIA